MKNSHLTGVAVTLAGTVFTGSARASRSNDYRIVKNASEVVRMGEMGWEYI